MPVEKGGFKDLEKTPLLVRHLTMAEDKRALLSSCVEASPEELAASILPDDREIHHPGGK